MTKRLYYERNDLFEHDTPVTSSKRVEGGYEITLSESIIFPGGGGDSADVSFINGISVTASSERDGELFYTVGEDIPAGSTAHCTVDREARRRRAQAHSGEHVLSGLAHSLFGAENVGFHSDGSVITLDLDVKLEREDIKRLESLAQDVIYKNLKIYAITPSKEAAESIPYRSKDDIEGDLRIVIIEGVDACACCALHVPYTGEIGVIKILDAIPHRRGTRITAVCGISAFEHYSSLYESALSASAMLSVKPSLLPTAVSALKKELAEQKHLLTLNKRALADEWMKNITVSEPFTALITAESDVDNDTLTYIAQKGSALSRIFAVLSPLDIGCRYVIYSSDGILKEHIKEINSSLGGKGGGTPEMVRGVFSSNADTAKELLKNHFLRIL